MRSGKAPVSTKATQKRMVVPSPKSPSQNSRNTEAQAVRIE
jgi:hypothetical protein